MSLFVSLQNCHSLFELSLFSSRAHSAFLSSWQCPAAICDFSQDTQFSQFTVPHLAKWFVGSSAILTEWDPGEGLNPESLGLGSYNLIPKEIHFTTFSFESSAHSLFLSVFLTAAARDEWVTGRHFFSSADVGMEMAFVSFSTSTSLSSSSSKSSHFPIIDLDTQALLWCQTQTPSQQQ